MNTETTPATIRRGLSEHEAKRFYDRHGRKLEWSEWFESRAKELAFSWVDAGPGERVLEMGVGCGHFLAWAQGRVGESGLVVGVDVSETMLALSREAAAGATLLRSSAASLPLAEGSFDWVFSSYVLDLLPLEVVRETLAGAYSVLRPGGHLVLCGLTEGKTVLERTFMGIWKRIHRLAPVRVGGCRPLVLEPLVTAAGFEIVTREHVGQHGMPSEVLRARRQ